MTTDAIAVPTGDGAARAPGVRLWLPVVAVALYWAYVGISYLVEMPTFWRFVTQSFALLGVILVLLVWWGFNRRVRGWDRVMVFGAVVASPVLAMLVSHRTMGPFPVFSGLPVLFTAWVVWLVVARKASRGVWLGGLVAVLFLSTGVFALFRMEGLDGAGFADMRWRWSRSAEERYLAERKPARVAATQSATLVLRAGDWPGFRGVGRDSVVRGVSVRTDWEKSPPRQVWRRAIGPGWTSMCIVDGRLFTQEQRGEREAVVCIDAASGAEVWSHEEDGRFWDALSSAGPRATPTFSDGKVYAQGATGTLICLEAGSGKKVWSRDVLADCGGKLPDWGVSSSPLVTKGVVVVFGSGQGGKGLVGYRADSGEVAWTLDSGVVSYSSAQLARIGGVEQALFISDKGLIAFEPSSGKMLWEYAVGGQPPRSLQPWVIDGSRVLVPLGMESPTDLIEVTRTEAGFKREKVWTSRNLKPSFNDFVVHEGHVYGFDVAIFSCVELSTGNRKWKKGRYGTGQVVLLADQGLLLVLSDQGKVVLVRARADAFEEVGEFQAIEGKTWNHPVVVGGRLYVRNAAEMACYEVGVAGSQ